ncbi:MAG: DUF4221 family protein [Bacteroidetes bacterium]|nr:DUF4221 family protein [Bacteroidota bacterium]
MPYFKLYLVLCFFTSCTNISFHSSLSYKIAADTISFNDKQGLLYFDNVNNPKTNLLILYRPKSDQLALIDLNKKREIKRIDLKTDTSKINPGKLESFCFHNTDSIFLLYEYKIIIIDSAANVKFSKVINHPEMDDWPLEVYGNFGRVFPIYYDNLRKELLIRKNCGSCGLSPSFYDMNVSVVYSFAKDTFYNIPVNYPNQYKRSYLGDAFNVYRELVNDSIIFAFNADPYITIYNRNDSFVSRVYSKSKYQDKEFPALEEKYRTDINRRADHLITCPLYMKILYDPYKQFYYRFFLTPKPIKNKDGSYNNFNDKELVIMVLNRNFKTVEEINLGKDYLWFFSFVTPKGLYVLKDTQLDENNYNQNEHKQVYSIISFN